ncbi:MAG: type II toxin-antitoxin system HipA family toxin [Candidatus Auribacterota bacterium]|nr:type II toxin-antitoxin system HipA family toxin [Candidatus Auribacterota bacterium]
MSKAILVYIDLEDTTQLVGRLWPRSGKKHPGASFEYDRSWLENPARFALEPALSLLTGTFHTPAGKAVFGAIGDSAPDRWGRVLMRRAARRYAKKTGQIQHSLREVDYLLQVDDEARQGALRFSYEEGGPFLAEADTTRIPPMIELSRLLTATEHVISEDDSDEDLRLLLAPGSSLGGARPKASIRDRNGDLTIAKFPHNNDEFDIVTWEAIALSLAGKAGISVPDMRIERIEGKPVLLLQRFDRMGSVRIPFLSAMSMIGSEKHEVRSYLEIVDALRMYGAKPQTDIRELWRRVVFTVLISNVDDHMRNHGFLYTGTGGWTLSPAYDLNPTPVDIKPRILSTAIDYDDQSASLENAFTVAEYFGINLPQARDIALRVGKVVSGWRNEARQFGISSSEIDRMATAFEHDDLKAARKKK